MIIQGSIIAGRCNVCLSASPTPPLSEFASVSYARYMLTGSPILHKKGESLTSSEIHV